MTATSRRLILTALIGLLCIAAARAIIVPSPLHKGDCVAIISALY